MRYLACHALPGLVNLATGAVLGPARTSIAENCALLQVSQLLGRYLPRSHNQLRKIVPLETGWGLNIVTPPEPRDGKVLLLERQISCLQGV